MTIWTRESIAALKEDNLSRDVLVPLFNAMGYHDVRFHGGGPLEQGKDLVMWRDEPLRGRVNIAVVVKATPIKGKTTTGVVIDQLREAFGKKYVDTAKAEEVRIHECCVVTPREISKEGANCLEGLVSREPFRDYVEYIDGVRLWDLIEKYLGSRILLPRLAEAYHDLTKLAPGIGVHIENHNISLNFTHTSSPIAAWGNPTFANTADGATAKEAFERFLSTGEPTEMPASGLSSLPAPELFGQLGFSPGEGTVRVGTIGKPLVGSIVFRSDRGREVVLENIELAVTAGTQQIRLSNAHQRTPFVLEMRITLGVPPIARVNYSSDVVGWSAHWLERQQRALDLMAGGCQIVFRDATTGIEHGLGIMAGGQTEKPNRRFHELVKEVAWIEDQIREPILIPARPFFTPDDVDNLAAVRQILATGKHPLTSASVVLQAEEDKRDHLVKSLRTAKHQFELRADLSTRRVLDTDLQMGPIEIQASGTELFATVGIEKATELILRGEAVEIEFRRKNEGRLFVRYPWWGKSVRR